MAAAQPAAKRQRIGLISNSPILSPFASSDNDNPGCTPFMELSEEQRNAILAPRTTGVHLDWKHQVLDKMGWLPVPAVVNSKLNIVQTESKWSSAKVTIDGELYVFCFLRMVNIRLSNGRQRSFRWTNPYTAEIVHPPVEYCHPDFRDSLLPPWEITPMETALRRMHEDDPQLTAIRRMFEVDASDSSTVNRIACVHAINSSANDSFWYFREQHLFTPTRDRIMALRGSEGKVVMGWHGTSSQGVVGIVTNGFLCTPAKNGRVLGEGAYFATEPSLAAAYSPPDDCGLKHVLLCELVVGRAELAQHGMTAPSSSHFDNALDNLTDPKRIVIWMSNMSTHILVRYVVSFRTFERAQEFMLPVAVTAE